MSIQLEQVEMVRERARVTYAEAKEALEKCNNDILEALIYLERENKVKAPKKETTEYSFFTALKKLIKKGNEIKFVIHKADAIVMNVPLNIMILITIFVPPLTIVGILAALFTNHKIRFEKPEGSEMEINQTFDKISTAVNSVSNQMVDAINKN